MSNKLKGSQYEGKVKKPDGGAYGNCILFFEPDVGKKISYCGNRWEVVETGLKLIETTEEQLKCEHKWTGVYDENNPMGYIGGSYMYCEKCRITCTDFSLITNKDPYGLKDKTSTI